MGSATKTIVPVERVERVILVFRGQRVLLDSDLAEIYQVETKALVRAVKRNIERFPSDFMFQLSPAEFESLRRQSGTSNPRGGRRYRPYAFTEYGAPMLAAVLHSPIAVQASILIVRAFVRLRELLSTHEELRQRIEEMEKKYDKRFAAVFDAIRELIEEPKTKRKPAIGYHTEEKKKRAGISTK